MEGYISEVRIFAGTYAPLGWALCNGQLINISDSDALYSLIGTTYGGDGVSNFALPDLRGRMPVQPGLPPSGGSNINLGQQGGSEVVGLTYSNLAPHTHTSQGTYAPACGQGAGTSPSPKGAYPANSGAKQLYNTVATPDKTMLGSTSPVDFSPSGGTQAHENMSPWLALNYIICMEGVYPPHP
jgi:microcystin-dependent protein